MPELSGAPSSMSHSKIQRQWAVLSKVFCVNEKRLLPRARERGGHQAGVPQLFGLAALLSQVAGVGKDNSGDL
jgi:hypothetical protein